MPQWWWVSVVYPWRHPIAMQHFGKLTKFAWWKGVYSQYVYMVLNWKCTTLCIDSFKDSHPISPSRNHRQVGHLSHEKAARFCKACPWKEPGFNVPADARMGWGSVFWGWWVDSLGFVSQISLVLILWLNFFWRNMKRKEILMYRKSDWKSAVVFWFG